MRGFSDFSTAIASARTDLTHWGSLVDPGRWQGVPTGGRPDMQTIEVMNWGMSVPVHREDDPFWDNRQLLAEEIKPNLPWADDHFEERVSRNPTNPGEAYKTWPWWRGQDEQAMEYAGTLAPMFTHTYQERFWPKHAGDIDHRNPGFHMGIHYSYGDLDDLVTMLFNDPQTRQAYLPIFFPEDTGAVHGGRIPCTLGYQFLMRNHQLHMWYFIRSCDFVRHFRDDIYLACRLLWWVLIELRERELRSDKPQLWVDVKPGYLHMLICSLHYHRGDEHLVAEA